MRTDADLFLTKDAAMRTALHYKACRTPPLTRVERERVTAVYCGLTCKHERIIQGAAENPGYRVQPLPGIRRGDLEAGTALTDVSACCPTTFTPVQKIVEATGTLYFKFGDLDATKPGGSVRIRTETILHYAEQYSQDIIRRKLSYLPPACPLLPARHSA